MESITSTGTRDERRGHTEPGTSHAAERLAPKLKPGF